MPGHEIPVGAPELGPAGEAGAEDGRLGESRAVLHAGEGILAHRLDHDLEQVRPDSGDRLSHVGRLAALAGEQDRGNAHVQDVLLGARTLDTPRAAKSPRSGGGRLRAPWASPSRAPRRRRWSRAPRPGSARRSPASWPAGVTTSSSWPGANSAWTSWPRSSSRP